MKAATIQQPLPVLHLQIKSVYDFLEVINAFYRILNIILPILTLMGCLVYIYSHNGTTLA